MDSLGLHLWFTVPLPTPTRPIFTLGITLMAWPSIEFYYLLVTLCLFYLEKIHYDSEICIISLLCTLSHMRVDHMWGRGCTFSKHGILSPTMDRWRPIGHEFFMLLTLFFFFWYGFCLIFLCSCSFNFLYINFNS